MDDMTDRVRLNYLQFVDGRVGEVPSIMRCFENVDTQPREETREISNYARYEARPKFPINSSRLEVCKRDVTTGKRQLDELEEFNERSNRLGY